MADREGKQVLPKDTVRRIPQPVMVECASPPPGGPTRPIAVVPLLDGDRIAGLEIRCGCGATAVVECVYQDQERP